MANGNGDALSRRENFWIKIAGSAFALWSLMLPVSATMIVRSIERESIARETLDKAFTAYREDTLRSIVAIAERQRMVLERLDKLDRKIDELDRRPHSRAP